MDRAEAAVGCILGTAVGDALGLACEGLSSDRQRRWFPSLDSYHLFLGKGLCSDDTEHTCMIAQSIAGLALRNAGFFILVLVHGLRRLLPPY